MKFGMRRGGTQVMIQVPKWLAVMVAMFVAGLVFCVLCVVVAGLDGKLDTKKVSTPVTTPATVSQKLDDGSPTGVADEDAQGWDCRKSGNHVCGPLSDSQTAAAADDVHGQQLKAGTTWTCWAEANSQMPEGYEVMCDR